MVERCALFLISHLHKRCSLATRSQRVNSFSNKSSIAIEKRPHSSMVSMFKRGEYRITVFASMVAFQAHIVRQGADELWTARTCKNVQNARVCFITFLAIYLNRFRRIHPI